LTVRAALAGLALLCAAGCAPIHRMDVPAGFKKYERTRALKMITADGVMLKAREVENYPRADLRFWTEALRRHLTARGYVFQRETSFRSAAGLAGCTLEFVVPHGGEDWVMSETLFVVGPRVVLVEAAGVYERFVRVGPAIEKALRTFVPGE
jgi:hypothetical protein